MFKRRTAKAATRIAEFWQWWSAVGAEALQSAIATGAYGQLPDEVSRRVAAIHPELEWELAAGVRAAHALCITAAGVAERRPLAERIYRAAPPVTAVWEYRPARCADPNLGSACLRLGPHELLCGDARYRLTVDDDRQVIDVGVFHPLFPQMPADARLKTTFLLLDWLLGEDGVERWVGGVEALPDEPADGLPADGVTEVVESLAARHVEPTWALLAHQPDDGR